MKKEDFEERFKKIVIQDGFVVVHTKCFDFISNNYYISGDNVWLYDSAGGINLKMKAIKGVFKNGHNR